MTVPDAQEVFYRIIKPTRTPQRVRFIIILASISIICVVVALVRWKLGYSASSLLFAGAIFSGLLAALELISLVANRKVILQVSDDGIHIDRQFWTWPQIIQLFPLPAVQENGVFFGFSVSMPGGNPVRLFLQDLRPLSMDEYYQLLVPIQRFLASHYPDVRVVNTTSDLKSLPPLAAPALSPTTLDYTPQTSQVFYRTIDTPLRRPSIYCGVIGLLAWFSLIGWNIVTELQAGHWPSLAEIVTVLGPLVLTLMLVIRAICNPRTPYEIRADGIQTGMQWWTWDQVRVIKFERASFSAGGHVVVVVQPAPQQFNRSVPPLLSITFRGNNRISLQGYRQLAIQLVEFLKESHVHVQVTDPR